MGEVEGWVLNRLSISVDHIRPKRSIWRICFEWPDGGPSNVEIVDYHD